MRKWSRKKIPHLFLTWISPVAMVIMIVWYLMQMINIGNRAPEIQDGIRLSRPVVSVGEIVSVRVIVKDPDAGDEINYYWTAHRGKIGEQLDRFQDAEITYVAPALPGIDVITVMVYDRAGETDKDFCIVTIEEAERLKAR